jgi:SAM-dependent methyltransferase
MIAAGSTGATRRPVAVSMHPPDGTNDTHRRPPLLQRLRRAATAAPVAVPAAAAVGAAPEPPPPVPAAAIDLDAFARRVAPGRLARESDAVSALLYERLDAATVAAVTARIEADPQLAPTFATAAEGTSLRRHLVLHYGVWLGDEDVMARTGLQRLVPPPDVHAMAHGPLAAAGGLYEADLVANALASAGVDIAGLAAVLDFGSSSGRVLRPLAAAYPDTRWAGCDPNQGAIEWARTALPRIEWFQSGNEPPLPLPDGGLDAVYAISIWSHFEPLFGLRWFEEMRRVLRPGGHLVFTAHGPATLAYDAAHALRPLRECVEIERALYRDGHWFIDCFGEAGDWGVVNPRWGNSFIAPEFVLEQLCPLWRVVEFVAGRNQERQDVYVLARA